jgi:catechol 2,3-dioxygenase-like lactoylglutathione lyase family enzyme
MNNKGEKMLNIKGIDHINMNVKNLAKSIEFYEKMFGFEVKESGVSPMSGNKFAIIGESNKAFLAIYEGSEPSKLNHIGFNVENFELVLEAIKKHNIRVGDYGDENGIVNYPQSKSIYIYDPDENEIELSSKFGGGL